jgi:deazaflavin-dependent oxidoreductase (nitroreductase family)
MAVDSTPIDEWTGHQMADANDFNSQIIEEFRANHGVVGGPFEGMTLVLLSTVGAKSGTTRTNPLAARIEGDRVFVFASKAGAPTNPDWYHNILADPAVTVELGDETFEAVATVLEGRERDRVYAANAELNPGFKAYQDGTDRIIPVVALDRS